MNEHPPWLTVGADVIVRRTSFGGRIDHERRGVITKVTAKGAAVDSRSRFTRRGEAYVMTPRYLDYTTVMLPAGETS